MNEDFICYLWKYKLLNINELHTTNNENIEILKTGEQNFDSGPDFFNAKIKIGSTIWVGNIEIHIKSSDWFNHFHKDNKSYNNIILHVVYENDKNILRNDNSSIPCLEIKNKFDINIYEKYCSFLKSKAWVPCINQINEVDKFILNNWLDRVLTERLQKKSESILKHLKLNNYNWEETFYLFISNNFGFKINSVPFELLAKSLPQIYLAKQKNNLIQIEALLYGQAGFLDNNFTDEYPELLKKEYTFLKNKFSLKPIEKHLWKFLRLRPYNFPTIRISQFANLIFKSNSLFSKIIETEKIDEIYTLFNVNTTDYWKTHFVFDKESKFSEKYISKSSIDLIVINTIVSFLFVYGLIKNEDKYKDRAFHFLESLKPEKNNIIESWKSAGIEIINAYHSQALLELKSEYCNNKKCLNCSIGNYLLRKN